MSWCTALDVCRLIEDATRSTDPQRRAHADQRLRQEREQAINYGDVLSEIVHDEVGGVSLETRFAAAMQLEGMTSKSVWLESSSFSDKPAVTRRLLGTLDGHSSSSPSASSGSAYPFDHRGGGVHNKFLECICRCVGNIAAVEFDDSADRTVTGSMTPLSPWVEQLRGTLERCLTAVDLNNDVNGLWEMRHRATLVLLHAATLGRHNTSLWRFLADECVGRVYHVVASMVASHCPALHHRMVHGPAATLDDDTCMDGKEGGASTLPVGGAASSIRNHLSPSHASVVEFCIAFSAALASKVPVDPSIFLSNLFSSTTYIPLMLDLQDYVRLEDVWSVADEAEVVHQCETKIQLLTYMIHAPKREATHRRLLMSTLNTLTTMGSAYLHIALGEPTKRSLALVALVTEMLESVQAVLDTLPQAYAWADVASLFNAFLWFMVEEEPLEVREGSDDAVEESLVTLMELEETTLAGCGSGSPKAVSTSLVQLFLEHDPDALPDFVRAWYQMGAHITQQATQHPDDAVHYWSALTAAMTCMARQCEVNNTCLVDELGQDGEVLVLQPLMCKVLHDDAKVLPPALRCRMMYAVGRVLNLSGSTALCESTLLSLIQVVQNEASRCALATPVACVALHTACMILSSSSEVCHEVAPRLPNRLMECALWVASSAGGLGAYCGGDALSVLLDVAADHPEHILDQMWACGRLIRAVEAVAKHCSTATRGKVLTSLLRALCENHYQGLGPSENDSRPQHDVTQQQNTSSPSDDATQSRCGELQQVFHLVHHHATNTSNSNSSLILRSLMEMLPTMMQWYKPRCCCRGAMDILADAVNGYAMREGPHDDATTRALCVCVGTELAFGLAIPSGVEAAVSLFQECTVEGSRAQSQTVSNAALGLAVAAMVTPDRFFTADGFSAFVFGVMNRKRNLKDFNVTGAVLYPAMCLACLPEASNVLVTSMMQRGGDETWITAVGDFFALWASTLSFCDRRTQLYSLMGWHRTISSCLHAFPELASMNVQSGSSLLFTTPLPTCSFRKLKSLHDKNCKVLAEQASLLYIMLLGLADVCYCKIFAKLTNFTQHTVFDPVLAPNRKEYLVADAVYADLLQSTSAEGALKILRHWSHCGGAVLQGLAAQAEAAVLRV